MGGGVLT